MQSGLCPKCGRDKVYLRHNHPVSTALVTPPLVAMELPLHSYLCTHCGYSEVYSAGAKLVDSCSLAAAMIAAGEWRRVDTTAHHEPRMAECHRCGARLHGEYCDCCSSKDALSTLR